MTRSISASFSEIKIQTDVIRKYLGMPIILQLSKDIEQENEGDTFCGILTDVENNQVYMEKTSRLDDEDGKWIEWGDDFIRLDPTREDPTALEESAKLRLENIQFIYVCKEKAVLEQVQDMFVDPQ
ncbi:hypothetical protein OAH75_00895 [Nitrosopumilus sp.]|nr:hypothetical protein [Nitrosopumilus sp.]MDB4839860.1 hypothetical protein [Nitrosopumilus sp.]